MSSYVFKIATQEPEAFLAAVSEGLGANSRVAKQIQEQMPKPKPAEPTGDFVVVVADVWPPFHKPAEGHWTNHDGYRFDTWNDLAEYFPRNEFTIYRPMAAEATS